MIWLKILEQIKDPGFSPILTKGCCMVREWFTLTIDNLISWMTVGRGERGEREWQIGNWQVITAQCVGYLHQFIDLYIHLSCSLQCNPYINLQLHIELLLMHLSVIFKTSTLSLIQARKHSSLHASEHRVDVCFYTMYLQTHACHFLQSMIDCTKGRFSDWCPQVSVQQRSKNLMTYINLC